METGLNHLHNVLRWFVLIFALWAIIASVGGIRGGKPFTKGAKRAALFLLIVADVQLLLGLVLYYLKGYFKNFADGGMGEVMKNAVARFWTIEHTLGMLVAIIIIHVGYAGTKGIKTDEQKYKRLFWCTVFALIIIVISIPWPWRAPGVGRALMPGM